MKTTAPRPTIAILAAVPQETELIRSFWGPWKISDLGGFHLYRRKSAGMVIAPASTVSGPAEVRPGTP